MNVMAENRLPVVKNCPFLDIHHKDGPKWSDINEKRADKTDFWKERADYWVRARQLSLLGGARRQSSACSVWSSLLYNSPTASLMDISGVCQLKPCFSNCERLKFHKIHEFFFFFFERTEFSRLNHLARQASQTLEINDLFPSSSPLKLGIMDGIFYQYGYFHITITTYLTT